MKELDVILEAMAKDIPVAELKSAYEFISQSYRAGTKITLNAPAMQLAYVQARMPATVAVLGEVAVHLEPYQDQIQTLLDLGSGPGSVIWGLSPKLKLQNILCIDQTTGLLNLGKNILEHSHLKLNVAWQQGDLTHLKLPEKSQFDLVTLSYVLNELPSPARMKLVVSAWEKTEKFLMLVEPGTPQGFQNIRDARELLIKQGAHIIAPCTHKNICPMSGEDWCHFSQRLQRSKTHMGMKGTLPYEDEKYSYLIATKMELFERPLARVVKKPTSSSGMVELDLCSNRGLTRAKITKRQGSVYKAARKTEWGDGWDEV